MSKNVKLKSLLEGYAWERNPKDFGKPLPTLEDIQKAYQANQDIKEDYSTMKLKSNIDQKWADKNTMIDDLTQWLDSLYGAGGEDLYDDIIEALKYLADNHQPNM
jgi:hypothetical protein